MSLFGGPQPPPPTSPPSAQLATFASSPPPHPSSEPATARALSIEHYVVDDAEDESCGNTDDDERPNRFTGTTSAWKRHADNELNLQSSLSHLGADDLSRHLYIAHTLRSRLQGHSVTSTKPYQSKSRWSRTEAQENSWKPPRKWTAWPLRPSEVPRKWERFGEVPEIDPEDDFTIREEGFVKCKPSRDLEELILSAVLRRAKEQWHSREEERKPQQRERNIFSQRRRPEKKESAGIQERDDSDFSDNDARHQSSVHATKSAGADASLSLRIQDIGDRSRAPESIRPVITADDDAAQRILQPSIRSLLSNLDSTLAALHRSRQNHVDSANVKIAGPRKRKEAGTDAEDIAAEPPLKRARGRPPVIQTSEPPAEPSPAPRSDGPEAQTVDHVKPRRGRPAKQFGNYRLPGESYYFMHKRLRAQENAAASAPISEEPQPHKDYPRCSPSVPHPEDDSATEEATIKASRPCGSRTFGLRDWSEILGTAALIGSFKPSVVQRAAQRCSNIFHEGMKFYTLDDSISLEKAEKAVDYVSGRASPPSLGQSTDVEAREQHAGTTDVDMSDDEKATDAEENLRPIWDGISKNCPHASCQRHVMPFRKLVQLRAHVRMKHGYKLPRETSASRVKGTPSTAKSKSARASRVEMEGAVHVDGFLKPITRRSGWRGRDAAPRERRSKSSAGSKIMEASDNAKLMDEGERSRVEETGAESLNQDGDGGDGGDESEAELEVKRNLEAH